MRPSMFSELDKPWKIHTRKINADLKSKKESTKQDGMTIKDIEDTYMADTVVSMSVYKLQDNLISKMYTDQTGKFLARSW